MKKKFHMNAKKAFMDYKLELSGEIGLVGSNLPNKKHDKDYSKDEYAHLGRS